MWIQGMLNFWVGISAASFRWTNNEDRGRRTDGIGSRRGRSGAGTLAALAALFLLMPSAAEAQTDSTAATPPAEWSIETEVGASVFFGATDQTTVATELGIKRESRRFEFQNDLDFLYGEATDDEGESFVNKRSWELASNLDYRGFSWANPYVFGGVLSSLEKRIHRRYKAGGGAKLTAVDTDVSRLDFSAAILVERTESSEESNGAEEWLGRWTGGVKFQRSFSEERAAFEAGVDYNPKFQHLDNFTFKAESSLAFRLSEIVSLKLSVRDNYDNQAKERGAASSNDGRVLFSVLASF